MRNADKFLASLALLCLLACVVFATLWAVDYEPKTMTRLGWIYGLVGVFLIPISGLLE